MSVQMNLRRPNRASDVGRGLSALAGVVALVVGVPVALLAWVGSPLPAGVPALSEVTSAVRDTYIPDEFLVKALALVVWLVWLELAASLLVEAVAYVRGRKAGSVPLAGGLQRGAARLVAAVALLGALMATRSMPEPASGSGRPLASVAQAPVALVVDDDVRVKAAQVAHEQAAVPEAAPTYQVQRRDTLWDIAERHLGDPFRWQEIFQLNQGCPQADGGCLTDPDLIFAGWQLELPADAIGVAVAPAPAPAAAPAPAPRAAPEPAVPSLPEQSSVVLDRGMVLIDDGHEAAGDVLLVSESPGGTGGAGRVDGMVLLPDAPGGVSDAPAVLAGPPEGEGSPGPAGSGGDPDEIASPPESRRGMPPRPADND
jgi:hypothetical protein